MWLSPRTLSAPRICWSEPRAQVVRIEHPYVVVTIEGREHRVHADNVRRTEPGRAHGVTHVRPKLPPQRDGYDQPALL
ncbi:hypothetical protein KRM28CT15_69620 [Krasilnikovia sp. M28-CT-15]